MPRVFELTDARLFAALLSGGALIFGVATWFRYRTNSVASLSAVGALPIAVEVIYRDWRGALFALLLGALVWWSHRDNLQRLRAGTEPRTARRA